MGLGRDWALLPQLVPYLPDDIWLGHTTEVKEIGTGQAQVNGGSVLFYFFVNSHY